MIQTLYRLGIPVLVLALHGATFAYIPPSFYLMEKIAGPRENLRSLYIKNNVSELSEDGIEDPRFYEVVLVDFQKKLVESRLYDSSDRELYSVQRRLTGARIKETPILNFLFFGNDPEILSRAMRSRGVPVRSRVAYEAQETPEERRASEDLHLKRVHDEIDEPKKVFWLVGKEPNELESHQVWLERHSFKPVRLITTATSSDTSFADYRFEGYKDYGRFSYPKKTLVYRENLAVFGVEAVKVLTNPKMDRPSGSVVGGFTERGQGRGDDDRRFILQYYSFVH
jgi:hypothetical protein